MSSPPDIESPSPAVSSLRSRFEKLAADTSLASTARPIGSHGLLTPEPLSPRPRAMSSSVNDSYPDSISQQTLRAASSSSDLKAGYKRPPPPPPLRTSRASSPATPGASPLLRPVPDPPSSQHDSTPIVESNPVKYAQLSRKPPPLPPHQEASADLVMSSRSAGVASLISKFGSAPVPIPVSHSSRLTVPPRVISQTTAFISNTGGLAVPSPEVAEISSKPPHRLSFNLPPSSLSLVSASSSSSVAVSQDPFGDALTDTEATSVEPPPLPFRKHHNLLHDQESENVTSSSSGSCSSRTSSESDVNVTNPPMQSSRPSVLPPRPPPRHKYEFAYPPPLPARKGTPATPVEDQPSKRLPARHQSMHEADVQSCAGSSSASATPPPERKPFGVHPPPPTRTIGLNDKLPPPRRAQSGSSSESGEDDDLKMKIELLPDTTRSSRRPPTIDCHNYSEFNIHMPAYTSVAAVSGHTVAVAVNHHLKIYDLSASDAPIWNLDSRESGMDTKLKEFKITSMEFRPAVKEEDRGSFLWLGTKDGHLLELDIRSGTVVGMRPAAHAHTVTHMFRHGRSMVTVDDTGKVLVFTPDTEDDVRLPHTQPRVMRIADKQEFAKMIGTLLWTSTRDPAGGGSAPNTSRGPIVRVYDVFSPGTAGKSLLPTEHLGAVTSGTLLSSQPNLVFLGHEGGHVSIWNTATEDGVPQCQEAIKVSASDVLSLEGVNDRLWAGGRKGMIAAYDVVPRPWVMTNCWMAHQKLPVLRLAVDTWSIEKLNRLTVYSIGRDERLRFWDGLLGTDWIEQELLKREVEFSSFRNMNVLIVSWNLDSAKPDTLNGTTENVNFLQDVLSSVDCPDIIAFGFQELIDLESRKMAAKTVLYGGKNKLTDGTISQKVTTSYKKWYDRLVLAVKLAMPPDAPYTVIHTENLVGLFSCIFVKNTERISLKHVAITTVKRGMGGRYGNKGGIVARFVIDDTSICFINCHLAAGQHHVRQRNADVAAIVEDKTVFPECGAVEDAFAYVNGGDGSMVLDHEIVFMNGDMNYRIDQRKDAVVASVKANDFEHLLVHDQLRKEMKFNRGFRLRSFTEGPLTFAPTYKYDRRSSEYDSSEKSRVPAWCDRVLWRSRDSSRVEQLHYRRYEVNVSDHRPISSGFRMTVKSVHHDARARIKAEVQTRWTEHEQSLLSAARQFYIDQAII
ncbi:Synaptojanin-1 [Grifola frondosa]|uniref:Synaptojanin-1 n=1 Tax=Grifola frondosa TaxID=5627 RepID=A0A1C7M4T7_GRIFR|nr:Synaptojanin-1 [Grifola frondosa]